jgi:hypothetical protein
LQVSGYATALGDAPKVSTLAASIRDLASAG